jgi:hypothetical protein
MESGLVVGDFLGYGIDTLYELYIPSKSRYEYPVAEKGRYYTVMMMQTLSNILFAVNLPKNMILECNGTNLINTSNPNSIRVISKNTGINIHG